MATRHHSIALIPLIVCAAATASEPSPAKVNPATATTSTIAAPDLSTPLAIYHAVMDDFPTGPIEEPQLRAALAVVESAAEAEPKQARWAVARSIIVGRLGEKERAVEIAEAAVKLAPEDARAQFAYGAALFDNINNVGMFSKMGVASDGSDAFLKAARLDPSYISPKIGLIQFYSNAPSIAGGSMKKAREQAEAIVAIGGRAVTSGHIALAQLAAKDEQWPDAEKHFRLAADGATDDRSKYQTFGALAQMLVRQRNDAPGALKIVEQMRPLGAATDTTADFIAGQAHQKLGDHPQAIACFRAVLARNSKAVNTRYMLGQSLAATGDTAGAIAVYEELLQIAPTDSRADDVRALIKKLRKQR